MRPRRSRAGRRRPRPARRLTAAATRSCSPPPIASATWCRGSTATFPASARASPCRATASSCTTAARCSRSIRRSPNVIAPHKRPFNTLSAGFVMRNNRPLMTVTLMGGDMQAQGIAQVLVNVLDLGANLQAATDMARFRHNQVPNVLSLESRLFGLVGAQLQAMGHTVQSIDGTNVGGYQAIMFTPDPSAPAAPAAGRSRSRASTARDQITGRTARPSATRGQCSGTERGDSRRRLRNPRAHRRGRHGRGVSCPRYPVESRRRVEGDCPSCSPLTLTVSRASGARPSWPGESADSQIL